MGEAPVGRIARAFAMLRAFDEQHQRLTLSDLSRRTDLPINSVLRTARALVDEGALERDGEGRFLIGLALWELATLAPRSVGIRIAALPYLNDLQELTGHHALLTVREGDEGVLIERASPRGRDPDVEYRVGGRVPLVSTGGGLVLLAAAPQELRDRAIEAADATPISECMDGPGLRALIATVRRTNVAITHRNSNRSLVSAGVPIRDPAGETVAALSVVLPTDHTSISVYIPALQACARAIQRDAFDRKHHEHDFHAV